MTRSILLASAVAGTMAALAPPTGSTLCGHTTCAMDNGMMKVRTAPHGTSQVLYEGNGHLGIEHHCMFYQSEQACVCWCHPSTRVEDTAHGAKIAADRALRPVNGLYAAWSQWSACAPKNFGAKLTSHRTRTCTNPTPVGTGKACEGSDYEEVDCHDNHGVSVDNGDF